MGFALSAHSVGEFNLDLAPFELIGVGEFGEGRPSFLGSGTKWTGASHRYGVYKHKESLLIIESHGGGEQGYFDEHTHAIELFDHLCSTLPPERIWDICLLDCDDGEPSISKRPRQDDESVLAGPFETKASQKQILVRGSSGEALARPHQRSPLALTSARNNEAAMNAEWNAAVITALNAENNLLNTCKQLEQSYVNWRRPATFQGAGIIRQWPAIGELGHLMIAGCVIEFVTTRKRSILVQDARGLVTGEVTIGAGMAERLYAFAAQIVEDGPHPITSSEPAIRSLET
jgi:hypothetical protein